MPSAVWSGHLTFGLVSFPVEISPAARRQSVDFDLLHKTDHSRVRYVSYCQSEDIPLSREDIVKGFQYEKDQYVVIDPEELKKIAPPTAKLMEVLEFVDAKSIDPVFLDSSYYLKPGDGGDKPYSLLYAAMKNSGFSAIAQLAMHNREHTVIIRAGGRGMVLHTMFYPDEVKEDAEYRADTALIADKELKLAKMLVDSLAAKFNPAAFKDSYRERVEAMIQAKIKGRKVVASPTVKIAPVIDIMEALQRSLEKRKLPAAKALTAKKTAVKKKSTAA